MNDNQQLMVLTGVSNERGFDKIANAMTNQHSRYNPRREVKDKGRVAFAIQIRDAK